ncbi:FtsX-like permease family protein [Chitinophaga sp. SYP-B3965]|uniref:ABC transporter permease n=1 Tax=Chitinophaga sp. SYP-B3965 TaxID=2663120 RepID=UPI00129A0196|nr:ABC transporter permease [Chitinophaga sp. SYP-B3965]MRG43735.1 FtsX-like permease family protein [Chitinophaga sp. SYP-B3965]
MFRNYCKIAFRNLLRNKTFSFINISGLVLGMASAMLILLWIQHEVSYDRFHHHSERLFEVWTNNVIEGKVQSNVNTPELMGPAITADIPEVEAVSRFGGGGGLLFTYGEKQITGAGNWVDPAFLKIFNFPLVEGDINTLLNDPFSIVLTQQLAYKLFGNVSALGKVLRVGTDQNFTVTGVLKDLPGNSTFEFEYLNSSMLRQSKGFTDKDWTNVGPRTYVLLKPNASLAVANDKLKGMISSYSNKRSGTESFLYPVSQEYLYGKFENGVPVGGRIEKVRIFALIAGFILLIACINFMNLSTARSEKRAKEVGIRKVAGANKEALIGQFLGESLLIAFIAGVLAILTVILVLPSFNLLINKELIFHFNKPEWWLAGVGFILLTGCLAGSYPALFLSRFRPVQVLKGSFKNVHALVTPRKVLVVLQFSFAIGLIICTIIIRQQLKYGQERETGYERRNLVYTFMTGEVRKNYQLIKDDLLNNGFAAAVTKTQNPITQVWSTGLSMQWKGKPENEKVMVKRYATDGDMVKTFGMQLVQGRDIDVKVYPTDSTACLINEAAVKTMGFANPIGEIIFDDPLQWHVVGVVKDFISESPYQAIKPFMVKGPKEGMNVLHIKLGDKYTTAEGLAGVEAVFRKYNPQYPFDAFFVDEQYAKKFGEQQFMTRLIGLFSGLAILIACLGLLGLAIYMAENRTKEIGIRKVMGASVASITRLLTMDFMKLVVVALLIASPVAWYFMDQWLDNYNYRIHMSWWIFALAGMAAIAIAFLTISIQTIRAASVNPIKSLRLD